MTGAAVAEWEWTINGELYATSESITVPDGVKEGDEITVIVEDEEGNTASDTVTVAASLALESVESAGRINGDVNILVAYFSSEMDEINPADIEIRRVSDNKLFTVEKVTMTSDMLTATMTLTGTAAAAAGTEYLESNTPYNMIIKTEDQTLSKEFIIPKVLDNAVVTGVDADNEKIELGGDEYELGEGVTVDNYFELLGKTVTAEVDETGKITSYHVANLKTIIGAFKYTAATATTYATYKEVVSGTVYKTTYANAANASTYTTTTVQYNDKFAAADAELLDDAHNYAIIPGTDLAWGKIVLNPDGTIRTIQGVATLPNSAYVTANDEGVIKNGASVKVNLKDFVIISGDESIDKEDVAEGDVLIYSSAAQIGYVYTNPIEGTFTKNYGTKYVFDGEEYSQAVTALKNAKEANLTSDDVDDYIKAETELELYTDIAGNGVYVIGESAASTTTIKLFVTSIGTLGTGDAAGASVTGFNPATEAMETYSWTGEGVAKQTTVRGWINGNDNTDQVPTLVKLTVSAEDGETVKKAEAVDIAFDIETDPAFLNGATAAGDGVTEIKKSTKLIGSTNANGMDPSSAKVVIYKNPTKATTAWKADNFTVVDFADWSGKLVDDGATGDTGVFDGTAIYGTLSKSVDFIFTDSAVQTSAGSIGLEAGTPFVGFVTEKLDGSSKRVKAITTEGEQTYETFFDDNKTAALAASVVGTFVVITPSKTFDDDETIYDIDALAAGTYVMVGQGTKADYAAYASNGTTLVTTKIGGGTYAEYDIASDALVVKKTVKDGNTSYALSTATAISKYSPVAVCYPAGNTTIAKMVLFADADTPLTASEAGAAKAVLTTAQQTDIETANGNREAEKAAIDALTFTIDNAASATTATVTVNGAVGTVTAAPAYTKTSGSGTAGSAAVAGRVLTVTSDSSANETGTVGITVTGTYYKRVVNYTVTITDGDANEVVLAQSDSTVTLV